MSIPRHHFFLSPARRRNGPKSASPPPARPVKYSASASIPPPHRVACRASLNRHSCSLRLCLPDLLPCSGESPLVSPCGQVPYPSPSHPRNSAFPRLKHVQQPTRSAKQAVSRQSGPARPVPDSSLGTNQARRRPSLPVDTTCLQTVGVCLSTHSANRIGVGYSSQVRRSTVGSRGKANRHGYCQRFFH